MKVFMLKHIWKFIATISIFAVVFFKITGFIYPGSAVIDGIFDDGEMITKRSKGVQYFINFIYFTFVSNIMVMVVSVFRAFNKENKMLNIFIIIAASSITMTMIVYWVLLFDHDVLNVMEYINTVFVHLIVPLLFLTGFVFDVVKKRYTVKLSLVKTASLTMIFPLVWFIIATIFYYSLGGGIEHAIYPFLHHNGQKFYESILYVTGIGIAFMIFSLSFTTHYRMSIK